MPVAVAMVLAAGCGGTGVDGPSPADASIADLAAGCERAADCPARIFGDQPACCAGVCIEEVRSDIAHCGGCDVRCGPWDHADAACTGGRCRIASCSAGFADCDGRSDNGCEIDLQADSLHCGRCDTSCRVVPNAPPLPCVAGTCRVMCENGARDCDGDWRNGCEINLLTDPKNCGSCGNACGPGPHGQAAVCVMGACGPPGCCGSYYCDCDKNPANGCETDTGVDPSNCGACGNACPRNAPNCIQAVCRP